MDGLINLNKSLGITSHGAVARVRRFFPGVKVGHAGTLDPAATGVLPLCLGRATRLSEYIMELSKGYRAAVTLGACTATGDAAGEVLSRSEIPSLERGDVLKLFGSLTGLQQQATPAFSAAKYRGRPLYDYARRGEDIPVRMRTINIYRLELTSFSPLEAPHITCEVECSRGTYIRALAEEIGRRLGCGAHLHGLERYYVGPFNIDSALTLKELEETVAAGRRNDILLPMDLALSHFKALTMDDKTLNELRAGQRVPWSRVNQEGPAEEPPLSQPLRLYNPRGDFRALASVQKSDKGLFLKTDKYLAP